MGEGSTSQRTARRKAAVLAEHGDACWLCGQRINLELTKGPGMFTLDHVVPKSHGGGNAVSNLRPAHELCNRTRGDRLVSRSRRGGLRVLGGWVKPARRLEGR